MRKASVIITVLALLALMIFSVAYFSNEEWIRNYNDGNYQKNAYSFLGFTQPVVALYNEGNACFQTGQYEVAKTKYEKALEAVHTSRQDCDIRINLALAMVAGIDLDNMDDKKEIKDKLEKAKDVIKENGYAKEDGTGSDKDAQKLLDEINVLLKQMDEEKEQEKEEEKKNEEPEDEQKKKEKSGEELKEKYRQMQKESTEAREKMMESRESFSKIDEAIDFEGKTW